MSTEGAKKLILLNTSIGSFLAPFTSSVISFAVPEIGETFRTSFYEAVWIPLSFLIALASLFLISGRMSDDYGKVKLYRTGLALYTFGMVLSMFSESVFYLMITLFIGGVGAALTGSNSTAIISLVYEKSNRGRALGINVMSVYLGLTLAPVIGGIIIHFSGWRYVLAVAVPVAIIALVLTFFSMNNIEQIVSHKNLDIRRGIMFTAGLFLIVFYLSIGNIYGWYSEIYLLISGIVLLSLFFYLERKVDNPLLDIDLFLKNRTFSASNLTALLNYLSTFSIVFIFSLYMQLILKYSAYISGLILISEPVLMVAFAPISGILSDKFGSRVVAAVGMATIGFSFIYLYFEPLNTALGLVVPLAVIGTGFGLFSAANTNSVMGSVRREQYGVASGTLGTMRFTGQLLSISIASLILATSLPKSVIIGMFSGITYSSILQYSNEFVQGFRTVMAVSGIISLLGAVTSLLKTRGT